MADPAAEADADTAADGPQDRPPAGVAGVTGQGRRLLGVGVVALLVLAAVWSLVPVRLAMTGARDRGEQTYAAPANGDHMYYASMMLQYAGTPYLQSLDETAAYFRYPGDWHKAYFLNPDRAPLIYPRSALPLLGTPLVPAMGVAAIFVPGILCGLATVLLLVLLARRWGVRWALAPPLLVFLLSPAFAWYATGLYTESILALVVVGAALCLPLAGRRPGLSGTVWLAVLAVVGGLTRQAGLVVPAMVVAGLLGAVLLARGRRREELRLWAWPTAAALVGGLGVTAVVSVWAPYDVLAFTRSRSGGNGVVSTVVQAFLARPRDLVDSLKVSPAGSGLVLLLLVVGVPCALWLLREPLGWVILGAASFPVATASLNGTDTLRYVSPVYPLLVLAIGVVLHRAVAARRGEPTAPPAPVASPRWLSPTSTVLAVVTGLLLVGATVAVYRPAPLQPVGVVTAEELGKLWPLDVPSATAYCGGDDGQVWLESDGRSYALSGTALARRGLLEPSAAQLRSGSKLPWATSVNRLLNDVLARCTPPLTSPR